MGTSARGTWATLLAERDSQLKAEQQMRLAIEARAVNQIQKLADNNVALARLNNKLTSQLDKLRTEHDQQQHLAAGQQAVARAKEKELAAEINGLKHLLKDSFSERTTLHAQLVAKQEIVRYLEWRLAQMEQLVDCGTKDHQPCTTPAFKAAAHAAAGDLLHPRNSTETFEVHSDKSASAESSSASGRALPRTLLALGQRGLIGIPPSAWIPSEAVLRGGGTTVSDDNNHHHEKENLNIQPTERRRTPLRTPSRPRNTTTTTTTNTTTNAAHQVTPLPGSALSRAALVDITPQMRRINQDGTADGTADDVVVVAISEEAIVGSVSITSTADSTPPPPPSDSETATPLSACRRETHPSTFRADAGEEHSGVGEKEDEEESATPKVLRKELFADRDSSCEEAVIGEKQEKIGDDGNGDDDLEKAVRKKGAHLRTPIAAVRLSLTDKHEEESDSAATTTTNIPAAGITTTPASGLRSSSRHRPRVSYALPSVNRKLRQGDPFTFGDPSTISSRTTAPPRSRTKPRAKYSAKKSIVKRRSGAATHSATPLPAMAEDSSDDNDGDDGGLSN